MIRWSYWKLAYVAYWSEVSFNATWKVNTIYPAHTATSTGEVMRKNVIAILSHFSFVLSHATCPSGAVLTITGWSMESGSFFWVAYIWLGCYVCGRISGLFRQRYDKILKAGSNNFTFQAFCNLPEETTIRRTRFWSCHFDSGPRIGTQKICGGWLCGVGDNIRLRTNGMDGVGYLKWSLV